MKLKIQQIYRALLLASCGLSALSVHAADISATVPAASGFSVKGSNGTERLRVVGDTGVVIVPALSSASTQNTLLCHDMATGQLGPCAAGVGTGATGAQGPVGPAGPQGPAGATGPAGTTGTVGATGPAGPTGATGTTGATGATGAGVPTGGTAGQVLSKIDGTDFNTQWVAPAAGGGSAYPNVELSVINSAIQSVPDLTGGASSTLLTFSTTNNANASLTGGSTWNGSVFTVGSTGAGWYQINAQAVGVTAAGTVISTGVQFFMDRNNTVGAAKTGALYRSILAIQSADNILKNQSSLNALIYLSAGDTLQFRGFSSSNATAANTSADGSTYLNIVRLK